MPTTPLGVPGPEVTYQQQPGGDTRLDVKVGERSVSHLFIVPMTIRIGAATLRMDGIAGVGTEEDCRYRGYSRLAMESAVARMADGDAALTMLYGIRDFYTKFGYATAGPDHFIHLLTLKESNALPAGWTVRAFEPSDLADVRRLYERNTETAVGARVRGPDAPSWRRLMRATEEEGAAVCRVVVGPDGSVDGYLWRGRGFWWVDQYEQDHPNELLLSEVMAGSPPAADAALAACRHWAAEESTARDREVERVVLGLTPEGPVAAAAMRQDALWIAEHHRCGGSMVRLLSVGRLLRALQPELEARLFRTAPAVHGRVLLRTDEGSASLEATPRGLAVWPSPRPGGDGGQDAAVVEMPQTTLARLALGAFPPGDLLDRLPRPPEGDARRLLEALFPLRHPHMHHVDRF